VVIITAYGSLDTAIAALRNGASDYILKPIEFDELLVKIRRLLAHRKLVLENQYLRKELKRDANFSHIVGKSPEMQKIFDVIQKVSGSDSTILISGLSGTGKELVARAIHFNSRRAAAPFIAVNAGAIPESLIESELFGHKRGSFTGAVTDKSGYFKAADGGTLFLDEISEMPLHLQVKLLRAIEQREITPVGMSTPVTIDVRFLASTNRDLQKEIAEGRFRQDLYYRLNVVEVHLPSLEDRKADIPLLVEHFVEKYKVEMRKPIKGVNNEVMRLLMFIALEDLPEFLHAESGVTVSSEKASLETAMNDFERQYITMILRKNNHNKEQAAQDLGISLPTLYRRIKDLAVPQ
jgi:two-component system response regulator PilR (NtrC family)